MLDTTRQATLSWPPHGEMFTLHISRPTWKSFTIYKCKAHQWTQNTHRSHNVKTTGRWTEWNWLWLQYNVLMGNTGSGYSCGKPCLCRGGVIKISGYIIWFNNTPTTGRCQLKAKSKVGSWVACVAALEPLLGRKILKLLKFIRLGSILFHLTRSLGKYGFV